MVRECRECGKFFNAKNSQQVMCSTECRRTHARKYKKELAIKLNSEVRKCLVCGKKFVPVKNNSRTCSNECKLLRKKAAKKMEETGVEPAWMINRKAREMGVSYGKYVAYMEGRIRL